MKRAGSGPGVEGAGQAGASASERISRRIAELGDWRGETLGRIRALIRKAVPGIVEEWKWGIPVWSHDGIVCTGETYKSHVKMTFAKGASVQDPARLFNSSLEGNVRRAIDIHEGEHVDAPALEALIRAAVALNVSLRNAAPEKGVPRKTVARKNAPRKTPSRKTGSRRTARHRRGGR